MSRIEDALAKLQARQANQKEPERRLVQIGAATERGADGPPAPRHVYGKTTVEVDLEELRSQGLLAVGPNARLIGDEYRTIKRRLLRVAAEESEAKSPNLIAVTSAQPGEGKTFACVNLSVSMANEHDWQVVLVDGDCVKRHLTKLFHAESEPGLTDLLRAKNPNFDSVVMPTSIPRLSIVPAGRRDENAAELFASAAMSTLCAHAASADRRRVILFDSTPLLLTAEAEALAAHCGQIVLVVRADTTLQQNVLHALEKLDSSVPIGLLLNQARARAGRPAYSAYYAPEEGPDEP